MEKDRHPLGVVVRKENFLGMVRGWKPGASFLEPGTLIPTHDGYFYMSTFWATGAPDIWSNILLGVSVRAFWLR